MFEHWVTVSYRQIILLILVGIFALVVVFAIRHRDMFQNSLEESLMQSRLPRNSQPAYFTEIQGNVQVKKVGQLNWVAATAAKELHPGDLVQTDANGTARVVFFDGSSSLLRPNSLTSIVESHLSQDQTRAVAVEVSSGAINLETAGRENPRDSARLMTPDAEARLYEHTDAEAQYQNETQESNFFVSSGRADVQARKAEGQPAVALQAGKGLSVRGNREWNPEEYLLPPAPSLLSPQHASTFTLSDAKSIQLRWQPVEGIQQYRVTVHPAGNPSNLLVNERVGSPELRLSALGKGIYIWQVESIGESGRSSPKKQSFKFAVLEERRGRRDLSVQLAVDEIARMGDIYRIKGRTDPGVVLLINGESAEVEGNGSFHHFTKRLPPEMTQLEIRARDLSGLTRTETVTLPR